MTTINKKQKAFTLIELLVVISIIGLLASIILVALANARGASYNTQRKATLEQLSKALELYFSDNGGYPKVSGFIGVASGYGSKTTSGSTGWIPNLAPTYTQVLPVDPHTASGSGYLYGSNNTSTDYKIRATSVDNCSSPPGTQQDAMNNPNNPTACEYSVFSPGGQGF